MNDQNVTPEDLVTDETFIAWFRQTVPAHIHYWNDWIESNQDKKEVVAVAVQMLTLLESKSNTISDEHTQTAKNRLMDAIHADQKSARVVPMYRKSLWWASAAAAIAAIIISIAYFVSPNVGNKYVTGFAETRAVVLPDGSQVTLNANSSLRMNDNWGRNGTTREVWLEGEAFFSVKHTANNAKFIVHTNDINVEVLGTEFNLQQRRHRTRVVLHTGKVQLTEVGKPNAPAVVMLPGHLVEYNDNTQKILKKTVNTELYSAWKEGKMVFENADFNEIAQVIEENYGLKMNTSNIDVRGEQFNGVFPVNNLQVLIAALEKSYNVDIDINDKEIIIHKK